MWNSCAVALLHVFVFLPAAHGFASNLGNHQQLELHNNATLDHNATLDSGDKTVLKIFHVSKTGGTAISSSLRKHLNWNKVELCNHFRSRQAMLSWTSEGRKVNIVFFVRAPVHRYTAGWLSRYRKGRPSHYSEWSELEEAAFTTFRSPNELACALSAGNPHTRREAEMYMNTLQHLSWSMTWSLGGMKSLKRASQSNSIAFVGRVEHFDDDYKTLVQLLNIKGALQSPPPKKVGHVHANPKDLEDLKVLSRCSVQNLRRWYKKDYELLEFLASNGHVDSSYPHEVAKLDEAPPKGKKRKFWATV